MVDQSTDENGEERYDSRSSKPYLEWVKANQKELNPWQIQCDRIDKIYSSSIRLSGTEFGANDGGLLDREFNIYWASVQVILPSVYSRPPVPVVVPKFKDRSPVKRTAAELLERSSIAGFDLTDIDQVMLGVRDGLVLHGRGVIWVSYESKEGEDEKVCIERLNRREFISDTVRDWSEVQCVARGAWMTRKQMRKRFQESSGELYLNANFSRRKDDDRVGYRSHLEQALVWEIWDSAEDEVTWVTEGCDEWLDQNEPHLKLRKKLPCPRPAYGTVEPDTLKPTPLFNYIVDQMGTINELTVRIHDLTQKLVVKGIVAAGNDVGEAVEKAYREINASHMLIPVASMQAMSSGAGGLVEWLPIQQVAETILAAVQSRREIIGNVQELLGIADIMRGDSEAQETAKAQTIKVQYGSVRVRDMINELVRIAKDTVGIMAEIMAEEFDFDTLLTMAQMELPTNAEIRKRAKDVEAGAKKQIEQIEATVLEQAGSDPEQAQQMAQQQTQAIVQQATDSVRSIMATPTEEQVRELLRDDKTRPFVFDIETDSTIYPDEQAEKQSRNEFMQVFTQASAALAPLAMSGPAGAKMAGELIKFQLAPYRAGRLLEGIIDEWIESLESMPQGQGDESQKELVEAQKALAQAEMEKARAAMANVQAKAQNDAAEMQRKMGEMQQKAMVDQQKAQEMVSKLTLEAEKLQGALAEQDARINKMQAETAKILNEIGLDVRKQDLEEYKAAEQTEQNTIENVQQAERQAFDQAQRMQEGNRADRSQNFSEQQGTRQQDLAERTAEKPDA